MFSPKKKKKVGFLLSHIEQEGIRKAGIHKKKKKKPNLFSFGLVMTNEMINEMIGREGSFSILPF